MRILFYHLGLLIYLIFGTLIVTDTDESDDGSMKHHNLHVCEV